MMYVPCQLVDGGCEYYYRVDDLKDMFSINHLIMNGKKVKISHRGIPESFVDLYVSKKYFQNGIYEGVA